MAKITHVKKAQPRYATKPVLDENGTEIRIALTNKDGSPKLTKHGRPVTIAKTVRDLERPLPPEKCDFAGCKVHPERLILPGMPYKHMSPRSGPYGGRKLTRHEECPAWNVWEYSSSLSARIAQIQHDAGSMIDEAEFESADDVESLAEEIATMIEELASEKNEAADSLEDGFGHETYQSAEIREQAEQLESWAEDVRSADVPEFPEVEDTVDRWHAVGPDGQDLDEEGFDTEDEAKDELETWLRNHPDEDEDEWDVESREHEVDDPEPTEEQLEEWVDEVRTALQDAVDGCPI